MHHTMSGIGGLAPLCSCSMPYPGNRPRQQFDREYFLPGRLSNQDEAERQLIKINSPTLIKIDCFSLIALITHTRELQAVFSFAYFKLRRGRCTTLPVLEI